MQRITTLTTSTSALATLVDSFRDRVAQISSRVSTLEARMKPAQGARNHGGEKRVQKEEPPLVPDDPTPLVDVFNRFGRDINSIKTWLGDRGINVNVTPLFNKDEPNTALCSYIEGDRRCSFRCRAMRESRHTVLIWVPAEGEWRVLASQFVRGAEVLAIQTRNMSTENVKNDEDLAGFADSQQRVMRALLTEGGVPLRGHLSFKSDGSLVGVSWYRVGTTLAARWREVLTEADATDPRIMFAIKNIELADKMKWKAFPVIRTNQASLIGGPMRDTLVSALHEEARLSGDNVPLSDPTNPSLEQLEDLLVPSFLTKCHDLWSSLPPELQGSAVTSMSFEAVCARRRTLWGHLQSELAVEYPTGSLKFLGHSYGDGTVYPAFCTHGAIHELVAASGLNQPASLRVTTSDEVNRAMDDLSQVIRGTMTEAEFFGRAKWTGGRDAPECTRIDAEGFVLMTDDGGEYSKCKVAEYYICHKLRASNIPTFLAMPDQVGAYFPLVPALRRALCPDPQSDSKLPVFGHQVTTIVTTLMAAVREAIENRDGPLLAAVRDDLAAKGAPSSVLDKLLDQGQQKRHAVLAMLTKVDAWDDVIAGAWPASITVLSSAATVGSTQLIKLILKRNAHLLHDEAALVQYCHTEYVRHFSEEGFANVEQVKQLKYKKEPMTPEDKQLHDWWFKLEGREMNKRLNEIWWHTAQS
eukprot:m.18694 g.18694  ORF g.18694 m.18694 type:complete len:697 (+) comp5353_c0_seq1:110-2200(+)